MVSSANPTLWLLARLWALPCTLIGLLVAIVPFAKGGCVKWRDGALEITYREQLAECSARAHKLPYRAIVLGHVILAVCGEELNKLRSHERVHVAQYERWGPVFWLAYPASSLWQWLRGRDPYRDNTFEIQARRLGG